MTHDYWMNQALNQAKIAFEQNEVPVGAVLVKNEELILQSHNMTRQLNNPLAHAEMLILNKIQESDKYLQDYTLYVTMEPCLMCSGAIILSRLGRLVFGCHDPKAGVCGSVYDTMSDRHFNHHPVVITDILHDECSNILKDFFKSKR